MYLLVGDGSAAEACFVRALEICGQAEGPDRANRAQALGQVGAAQLMQGRLGEAEQSFRTSLELARSHLPEWHSFRIRGEGRLGECLVLCGEREAAIPHLRASYQGLRATLGDEHPDTLAAREALAAAE
jgi:hypothetical protein